MYLPVIIAQAQPMETYQTLLNMQPQALFRSFLADPDTTILVGIRTLCQLFGAVFLLLGHAERSGTAEGTRARSNTIIGTGILVYLLFSAGPMLGTVASVMNGVPAEVGLRNDTPRMLTAMFQRGAQLPSWSDMWRPAVNVPGQDKHTVGGAIAEGISGGSGPSQPEQPPQGWVQRTWRWISTKVSDLPLLGMLNSLAGFIGRVWIAVQRLAVTSLFLLCMLLVVLLSMLLIWFMEAIRYLVLLFGACMIPLFIGFISSKRMQEAGWKYLTSMIAVTLWPIGWTICNAVTLELFDMAVRVASGDAGAAAQQTFVEGLLDPGRSVTWSQFSDVVLTSGPMAYSMGFGLLVFTGIWMILGAFTAPYIITKTVMMGEEFVFQSMTSTAKVTAKVAAESAKLAAQAAILAG